MDKQLQTLPENLEAAVQRADAEGIEFWFARDLQVPLGNIRWENFQTAINRAMESCEASGHEVSDHFRGVTKMITLGKRGQWDVDAFLMSQGIQVIRILDVDVKRNLAGVIAMLQHHKAIIGNLSGIPTGSN